jgi:hypothetical protein
MKCAGLDHASPVFAVTILRARIRLRPQHAGGNALAVHANIACRAGCIVVDHPVAIIVLAIANLGDRPYPALALPAFTAPAHKGACLAFTTQGLAGGHAVWVTAVSGEHHAVVDAAIAVVVLAVT